TPAVATAAPRPGAGSLLVPRTFAHALRQLARGGFGRLKVLRVASDRIDAQTVTPAGRLRSVQVRPGRSPAVLSTSPAGFPATGAVAWRALDSRAPIRLAAGALRRSGSRIDYAAVV